MWPLPDMSHLKLQQSPVIGFKRTLDGTVAWTQTITNVQRHTQFLVPGDVVLLCFFVVVFFYFLKTMTANNCTSCLVLLFSSSILSPWRLNACVGDCCVGPVMRCVTSLGCVPSQKQIHSSLQRKKC